MYGGVLSAQSLVVDQPQDTLIAAFANSLCTFSLAEGTPRARVEAHPCPILNIHYDPLTHTLTSIDQSSTVRISSLKQATLELLPKASVKKQDCHLQDARIVQDGQGSLSYYCLERNGSLILFSGSGSRKLSSTCSKILHISPQIIVFGEQQNKVQIALPSQLKSAEKEFWTYAHGSEVTAVEIYEKSLLVGDSKGKITVLVDFLEEGEVKLRQKLQWHTHSVASLRVQGSYLYSGGQEGVVVLWHLRQGQRDFLPRVGAGFINILVQGSQIFCLLNNNSIKRIDLGQDKAIVSYKLILGQPRDRTSVERVPARASALGDRIFLRGGPGQIQEINLSTGINSEHGIINRNFVSRLDSSIPKPHQVTDFCFSQDCSRMVAVVEGRLCRSLRFYSFDFGEYKIVSKVDCCHLGSQPVRVLPLGNKFISFSSSDPAIKVWTLLSRQKQSILQVQQHYWACQYELTHRHILPMSVSASGSELTVTYPQEFFTFNTENQEKGSILRINGSSLLQVHKLTSDGTKFLVLSQSCLSEVQLAGKTQKATKLVDLSGGITSSIFSPENSSFAILQNHGKSQSVYVYQKGKELQHFEVATDDKLFLTGIFWLKNRTIAFDSQLTLHDLTHHQDIVNLSSRGGVTVNIEKEEEEMTSSLDFNSLKGSYFAREGRKSGAALERMNEMLGLTPSIAQSHKFLSSQLLL